MTELEGYTRTSFVSDGKARDVYTVGSGPAVIVISEIPGITPKVAAFGRRVAAIAYIAAAVIILLRATSLGSPWLAVIANALGAFLMPLLLPALATATYNMAKASPCPFRFQMATEGG